ncbi:hypothetical protein [Bacteroides rodentium]
MKSLSAGTSGRRKSTRNGHPSASPPPGKQAASRRSASRCSSAYDSLPPAGHFSPSSPASCGVSTARPSSIRLICSIVSFSKGNTLPSMTTRCGTTPAIPSSDSDREVHTPTSAGSSTPMRHRPPSSSSLTGRKSTRRYTVTPPAEGAPSSVVQISIPSVQVSHSRRAGRGMPSTAGTPARVASHRQTSGCPTTRATPSKNVCKKSSFIAFTSHTRLSGCKCKYFL